VLFSLCGGLDGPWLALWHEAIAHWKNSQANAYIPLIELADISLDTGASYIYHECNQRFIPIKFSVRGRDLGGTVTEAQQRIAQNVKVPNGYRIVWAGEFESLQQAKERLAIIVPISLIMILALLYGLFNATVSWRLPASPLRSAAACSRSAAH
jgi:cobalt-zinc-cadmium resistance protein CzcA